MNRQAITILAVTLVAASSFAQEGPSAAPESARPPERAPAAATAPAPAVAQEPQPAPAPAPSPKPWVAGYRNGFSLQSEDGDYKLRLFGYVQADGRFAAGDEAGSVTDAFVLRRARPSLQGTVAKYFDFYMVPDFGGGSAVVQDAYLDVNFTSKLRVRAGKMKTPFGIERLQSGASLLFVERALPNNLVPNRDIGLQVHGELAMGAVGYQLAVLNGVADGGMADNDSNDAKDLAGRVFLQPWKKAHTSPLRGLGLGLAATHGEASPTSLAPVRSVSQVNVFTYASGVSATGDRDRLSPQGFFHLGRVGVLAEYVRSRQTASRPDAGGGAAVQQRLTHAAWSVTGSWLLTGEDASYGNVKPKSFFVPSARHWGALQLVARVNAVDLDDAAFAGGFADPARSVSRASAWGVGFNWIWNTNLKWVLDYERTTFEGGAKGGADRAPENSVQSRLQLSF